MNWDDLLTAIAVLGDSAWLLAPSAACTLYLWYCRSKAEAARWLGALLLCLSAVAAAKVAGYALIGRSENASFVSISGHAAFATFFYGSLALIAGHGKDARSRILLSAAVVTPAVLVAFARLVQRQHSLAEVVTGAGLAAGCLFLFARTRTDQSRWFGRYVAAFLAVAVVRLCVGVLDSSPEDLLQGLGESLAAQTAAAMSGR